MTSFDFAEQYALMQQLVAPAIEPGLARTEALLARLGNPERQLRLIQVGGTNGKGSVCALVEAILLAEGQRVGVFTSPHLHHYCERIRLAGQPVSEQLAADGLARVNAAMRDLAAANGPRPTEFEAATALALLLFAEAGLDWTILEVGLGGRYDATNVVDAELVVLTNIGRDHMEYLGDSLAAIAGEKAGIIKPQAMVFTAAEGEALEIFRHTAAAQKARLYSLGRELQLQLHSHDPAGQIISIRTPQRHYGDMHLALLGRHQGANAALAVAVAEAAGATPAAIRAGLAQARHPARLEIISRQPLVLLDGAHNTPGMAALAQALADYWPAKRRLALLGMLADKEREQAMEMLLPQISGAVISRPPLLHRSADWPRLADVARRGGLNIPADQVLEDIEAACDKALSLLPDYDMLVVCGSLYLVAEARAYLRRQLKPKEEQL